MTARRPVRGGWRQLRYPPEFRISADAARAVPGDTVPGRAVPEGPGPVRPGPETPDPEAPPAGRPGPEKPSPETPARAAQPAPDLTDDAVARVATDLWRARRKVAGPRAQEQPDRAVRMAGRHLAGAAGHLDQAGISVHDHDGQPYVLGLELVVLAEEHNPGVTRPTITETVRPTVRRAGRVIQLAEVIVGVPPETADRATDETNHATDETRRGHTDA
jgi:hypothetical protein